MRVAASMLPRSCTVHHLRRDGDRSRTDRTAHARARRRRLEECRPARVRGITVGPIENGYHPDRGYGSKAYERTLDETRASGGEWVAITPFGRVADTDGRGVDLTFEANRSAIRRAIGMAHARGLKVMLVPHLWVESGKWRALIDPRTDAGWSAWATSYGAFALAWARVAEETNVELFSAGVELRSWVTSRHATSFANIICNIRAIYKTWCRPPTPGTAPSRRAACGASAARTACPRSSCAAHSKDLRHVSCTTTRRELGISPRP